MQAGLLRTGRALDQTSAKVCPCHVMLSSPRVGFLTPEAQRDAWKSPCYWSPSESSYHWILGREALSTK